MTGYYDETLTPAPPSGLGDGMGQTPYPFNDTADVEPHAPRGDADHVGESPFSASTWDTDPLPKADDHSNRGFDRHRSGLWGPEKPGPFGS